MNRCSFVTAAFLAHLALANLHAQPVSPVPINDQAAKAKPTPAAASNVSFQHEIQHAIDRGLRWFESNQNEDGFWSTPDHVAVTALAVIALQGDPAKNSDPQRQKKVRQAAQFITAAAKPDGGIHKDRLVNYNTALGLLALLSLDNPEHEPLILKARQFLIRSQVDFGEKGKLDTPYDGGVGYGSSYEHSDMANTLQAIEALYYSGQLLKDRQLESARDLDWEAAVHFIESCQNLPSHNEEPWASADPAQRGGFVYYPGLSKAGTATNETTGAVALRSYGSISYAGLLSYIYAQLDKDDPRVQAVYDWLQSNYTLKENPGMGPQGLYYYYHTMAKALAIYGTDQLRLDSGQSVDWRRQLAMELINRQQPDGSWINEEHGRWWEKDPALVTAYATLALELIHRAL